MHLSPCLGLKASAVNAMPDFTPAMLRIGALGLRPSGDCRSRSPRSKEKIDEPAHVCTGAG